MAMLDWCNLHQREDECEWLCPARRWEKHCPYPSVCRDKEMCVDGAALEAAAASPEVKNMKKTLGQMGFVLFATQELDDALVQLFGTSIPGPIAEVLDKWRTACNKLGSAALKTSRTRTGNVADDDDGYMGSPMDENGCRTLPNGECVSEGPCIHTPCEKCDHGSGHHSPTCPRLRAAGQPWLRTYDGKVGEGIIGEESLSYGIKCAECGKYETACKCPSAPLVPYVCSNVGIGGLCERVGGCLCVSE